MYSYGFYAVRRMMPCKLCAVVKTARFEKVCHRVHTESRLVSQTRSTLFLNLKTTTQMYVRVLQNHNGGQHAY